MPVIESGTFFTAYYSGVNGVKISKNFFTAFPSKGNRNKKEEPPVHWEGREDWSQNCAMRGIRFPNLGIKAGELPRPPYI